MGLIVAPLAWAAPANDDRANASPLFGITNFIVSNIGATAEAGEPLHAGEPPSYTLWWLWTAPYTGTFRIVTSNSVTAAQTPLDTVVGVYTLNSTGGLLEVTSNDDTAYGEFGALWSRVVFRAYEGETLRIVVGSLGGPGSIRLEIGEGGPFMRSWQALDLQGQPIYSTNYVGRLVLLDFWETICDACIQELPDLLRLQDLYASRGFTLLGLSGDALVKTVQDYLAIHPLNYPIGMSTPAIQVTIGGFEVSYPTKYLIDPDGRIVATYEGGNTLKGYRTLLEPLLRTNPKVQMRIARLDSGIRVAWPAGDTAYTLQGAALPTGSWSDVLTERVVTNSELTVTFPASETRAFFRLIKR